MTAGDLPGVSRARRGRVPRGSDRSRPGGGAPGRVSPRPRPLGSRPVALPLLGGLLLMAVPAGCGAGPPDRAVARARETGYRGILLPSPVPKPDFTLTDTEGRPFRFRRETDGYVTLLFFGYTHCPDVCPVHLANIAAALEGLPSPVRRRIKVVFVSVDPGRDTPERIRQWLDRFDASFIGLRGEPEEVDAVQALLGLPPAIRVERRPREVLVGHSARVIAFTPGGEGRLAYPFGTRQADWAHDLPRLAAGEALPGR